MNIYLVNITKSIQNAINDSKHFSSRETHTTNNDALSIYTQR